jgi:hypothetical protein
MRDDLLRIAVMRGPLPMSGTLTVRKRIVGSKV